MRTLVPLLLAAGLASADSLLITEVVTDPQLDHSESAGGDAAPFAGLAGTGTVSATDEFVELFNDGSDAIDLSGYALAFADSSPSGYVFGETTGGTLLFSAGSSLTGLLPGGYVLLGNPPGSLNNTIDLELRDPFGLLVASLSIEDGNASGADDEAIALEWNGSTFGTGYVRAAATPLGPLPAVAEPSGLLLAALTLLGVAAARPRRARRGSARRRAAGRRARSRRT